MINVTVNWDSDGFEKEVAQAAIAAAKHECRKKVSFMEIRRLEFKFDKKTSSVIVDGPDDITRKLEE